MSDNKPQSAEENRFGDLEPHAAEEISKTELKRQSAELQKLGQALTDLSAAHLDTIPMDEELQEAVLIARKINKKKDGYRRQLQFIGKLLRQRDVSDIQAAMAQLTNKHQQANAEFHALEKARDAIIQEGDPAIQRLLESHPTLERQKLRQYHRQIQKERSNNAPPKAFRELFQYLKDNVQGQT
ncbi:DUF615 domain-containing protein [Alteromonas sp. ASW11-19]|uniref:Dual-action ribosomal maturation protein DarP n=1 Tax=Alteromonas salexigens TaxID=2982530 RepID=A0ABT2VMY0_9ALTE|nr:ribosome biogenesis factor YjgA [Alteromonas salexigens]MCU7554676.1 DUF615 domain-containing protein [Alteromonas salexigens]